MWEYRGNFSGVEFDGDAAENGHGEAAKNGTARQLKMDTPVVLRF